MKTSVLIRDYVCSVCWHPLVERCNDGKWIVECSAYGALHAGFHRYETATRSRMESSFELIEVSGIYRGTEFGPMLGLESPEDHRERMERYRRAMRGDGGGID